MLLLTYIINETDLLKDINAVKLSYGSSVPNWTTENRMINELGFYSPEIDYLINNYYKNEEDKVIIHNVLLDKNLIWYKKDSKEYAERQIKFIQDNLKYMYEKTKKELFGKN